MAFFHIQKKAMRCDRKVRDKFKKNLRGKYISLNTNACYKVLFFQ